MKKTMLALLALSCSLAGALEIQSTVAIGNLAFDTDSETALAETNGTFKGFWGYGGSLSATEKLGENISFAAGFERSATLRNLVFTRVGFDAGFAKLAVGPFFGPFNAEGSVLTSGLSTTLRMEWPGLAFGSFRSDSTIGAGIAAPGDYVQESSEVLLGFWVPNVVISARLASESFTYKRSAALLTVDERVRYEMIADVFKKNLPYTVQLNLGYENVKRSYVGAAASEIDEIGAAILGLELAATVTPTLRVTLGGEASLYAWGIGKVTSPPTETALFSVHAGVAISFKALGSAETAGPEAGGPAESAAESPAEPKAGSPAEPTPGSENAVEPVTETGTP